MCVRMCPRPSGFCSALTECSLLGDGDVARMTHRLCAAACRCAPHSTSAGRVRTRHSGSHAGACAGSRADDAQVLIPAGDQIWESARCCPSTAAAVAFNARGHRHEGGGRPRVFAGDQYTEVARSRRWRWPAPGIASWVEPRSTCPAERALLYLR